MKKLNGFQYTSINSDLHKQYSKKCFVNQLQQADSETPVFVNMYNLIIMHV